MIQNVVFDMGGVLLRYEPMEYIKSLGYDEEKSAEIYKAIFGSPVWIEFDRGTYSFAEGAGLIIAQSPQLEKEVRAVFAGNFWDILTIYEDTAQYLKELKESGLRVYILSNFSVEWFEYMEPQLWYLAYTDGRLISGYEKMVKPNRDIYERFIEKFGVVPLETVFIDDVKANVDAAGAVGIRTVWYENLCDLKQKLGELL